MQTGPNTWIPNLKIVVPPKRGKRGEATQKENTPPTWSRKRKLCHSYNVIFENNSADFHMCHNSSYSVDPLCVRHQVLSGVCSVHHCRTGTMASILYFVPVITMTQVLDSTSLSLQSITAKHLDPKLVIKTKLPAERSFQNMLSTLQREWTANTFNPLDTHLRWLIFLS